MAKGLAAALAAITALMLIPAAAPAKRIAGVNVKPGCDFIGTGVCQFPWPNDYFTKRDRRTDTGRRLALVKSAMPRNKSGKPIDPSDMNRADGFSPGSAMLVKVPGLDTPAAVREEQAAVRSPNLKRGLANALAGRRHQRAHRQAPPDLGRDRRRTRSARRTASLIIRPARNFDEGGRYIVALRNLKNATRQADPAQAAASASTATASARARSRSRARRPHIEQIFRDAEAGGRQRAARSTSPGTSRSRASAASPGACSTSATTRSRQLGDTNLKDLTRGRARARPFTVDSGDRPHARARTARSRARSRARYACRAT